MNRFALAGLLVALSSPASATAYCEIKTTADGFAALRAAPSRDARIVARMRAGDEVLLREGDSGVWRRVSWWRGSERLSGARPRATGFVHRSLVDLCG
jgi:hypothetical protein